MSTNVRELANKLGAEINGGWLNISGPGHSKSDRSLGIRFNPSAPDGFWISSLAGDDPVVCRKHVLALLAKVAGGDPIEMAVQETPANDTGQQKRIARALLIWQEARQ